MKRKIEISEDVKRVMESYDWPGNIRDLKNIAMYIDIMSSGDRVELYDLPHNFINIKKDYSKEIKILKEKVSIEKIIRVMEIIKEYNLLNKSIGRNYIVNELHDQGYTISEGEVRTILSVAKVYNKKSNLQED